MTKLFLQSLRLLLLLCATSDLVSSFALVPSTTKLPMLVRTSTSSALPKQIIQRPCKMQPLEMAFKPMSFLDNKAKLAGPLATLGFTLPQLQDLSIQNIQRVGETAFAAMVLIAAVQGALVSLGDVVCFASFHYIRQVFLTLVYRSCISMEPILLVN